MKGFLDIIQCSSHQAVTGKIYCLKQHFLPPATAWRFTDNKWVVLKMRKLWSDPILTTEMNEYMGKY